MIAKKTNWWNIAGYWFLLLASVNLLFLLFSIVSFASQGKGLLSNLANPFGASITILSVVVLLILFAIPYFYFTKSRWAIPSTILFYVFFEGGMKFLGGLYIGESIDKILGSAFAILTSIFLVYKVKQSSK